MRNGRLSGSRYSRARRDWAIIVSDLVRAPHQKGPHGGDPSHQVPGPVVRPGVLQRSFGGLELRLDAGVLARAEQHLGIGHPKRRPGIQQRGWERLQPAKDGDQRATKVQRHPVALDEALGPLDVMASRSMLEGLDLEAVGLIPLAGAEVVLIHGPGRDRALLAPLPQQIGEQMVVPVPAPLAVQGDDEQVGPIEVLEGLLAGGRGVEQHGITERAAEPIEDGRAQQEGLHGFGLPLEDFFDQIVEHEVVAAGERGDEAGSVFTALQRDRGELQTGDPALGPAFERTDLVGGEVEVHDLVEKAGGLGRGEAQIGGAQLGQLASGAQSGQGQRGILAGGDDQVHLGRQVLDQEGQRIVDRLGVEDVVVVENEHDIARDGGDVVEQGRQRRLRSVAGPAAIGARSIPLRRSRAQPSAEPRSDRSESGWGRCRLHRATTMPPLARSPRPIR